MDKHLTWADHRDYISFTLLCSIGGSQEIAQPRKRLVMSKLGYGCVAGSLCPSKMQNGYSQTIGTLFRVRSAQI